MTQRERVLDYIRKHGAITQFEATSELGILRLASRIHELKKQGHDICTDTATVVNRFNEKCRVAMYSMPDRYVKALTE